MTDTQLGILIAAVTALIGGFAAFLKWLIGRSPEKEDITQLTTSVRDLTITVREMGNGLVRLESNLEGILYERERTPIGSHGPGVPIPRAPTQHGTTRLLDDEVTPVTKPPRRTPVHGVPYGPFTPKKGT